MRLAHNVIQVNQPQNIQLYNRYMNGVDPRDQMCMKYYVGCFSVKAWKYILWYFVNTSIVNAYILYCRISTSQVKLRGSMLILTFDLRLQWDWLFNFHQEKGNWKPHCALGLWQVQMKTTMNMSTLAQWKERDANNTVCSKWGKKLYMSIIFAMYACVKMDAVLPTIINNM